MSEFRMPSLGSDMEAGTLVEQAVMSGDKLSAGDVIGAVETQKGVIEIEVFESGTFDRWLAEIGQTVPVGAPLAVIQTPAEEEIAAATAPPPPAPECAPIAPETRPSSAEDAATAQSNAPARAPLADTAQTTAPREPMPSMTRSVSGRRRITPAARRLAASRGVDVTTLDPDVKEPITRRDIEMLAAPQPDRVETDFRSAIAAAMARSKRDIPHYYLSHDVDLSAAEAFVAAENAKRAPAERLLLGAVCAKAMAAAIAKFPEFNGHYVDGRFDPSPAVHLGFAINLRSGGLVAPALFDADSLSLTALMQNLRDLSARVRAGRFRARELSDATITLTSLGERGTDAVFGVIYPPQVAIVGMGAARARAAVVEGALDIRTMATFTLAADHRVSDGHRGALFLRALDKHLQSPEAL